MTEQNREFPKYIKEDKDTGSLIVTLKGGIKIDGLAVKEVTMREPMLRDQLQAAKAEKTPEDREIYIVALVIGQAPADIETLSANDWARLQTAYGFFID